MQSPSRVIVTHSLEDAVIALGVAAQLRKPVILQSPPEAIFYAGPLYLLKLFEQAQNACPNAEAIFILNCADAGAETISAMQMGHRHIRSHAAPELRRKLADIAGHHGVTLHGGPFESLDLATVRDVKTACREWLQTD